MAYATSDDLTHLLTTAELAQLSDDTGSGQLDQAVIGEAIDQASREIDGYVGVVRPVPVNPVPGLISNFAAKLAIYNLFLRRSNIPEVWQKTYEGITRTLQMIAQGKITLGPSGEATEDVSDQRAFVSTDNRLFSQDALKGY